MCCSSRGRKVRHNLTIEQQRALIFNLLKVMKRESVNCSVMYNSLEPHDCSLPGSSVRGILQARILEWGIFSMVSSRPRDQTWVSCIAGRFFTI